MSAIIGIHPPDARPSPMSRAASAPTPAELGVGARFSVAVMHSDFASIILGALAAPDRSDLTVESDDVSTVVRGSEQRVLEFVNAVIAGAASGGHHVSASVLLSRGCPGELACAIDAETLATAAVPPILPPTGVRAAAHWSLYPLDDGTTGEAASAPDHMRDIYAAIDHAKALGTYTGGVNFATRLDGDLSDVLATIAAGWVLVGRRVQHVVSHATLSINSPSNVDPATS